MLNYLPSTESIMFCNFCISFIGSSLNSFGLRNFFDINLFRSRYLVISWSHTWDLKISSLGGGLWIYLWGITFPFIFKRQPRIFTCIQLSISFGNWTKEKINYIFFLVTGWVHQWESSLLPRREGNEEFRKSITKYCLCPLLEK